MKKLSYKILAIQFLIFLLISSVARILIFIFDITPSATMLNSGHLFIGVMVVGFTSLALFSFAINRVIVKRIHKLNLAVKDIEKGHYEVQVDVDGNDEVSELMTNMNLMAKELHSNEYLSKEFSKNVSHEFKTPLSSIKGYAELIETGNLTKEETQEYSQIIIHEVDRLAKLSKNLLQISLLDSVNVIKQDEIYLIDEQIRSVLQLTQLEWEAKNIEFDLNLDSVEYIGNKELTFQIWQNLIANAIKFSPEKSVIRISLSKNENIEFEIEDHGQGISEEDQEKIFNQFFIADKSRNKSGSGLGLSITKSIVEKLGGTISFVSREKEGTTFKVILKCNKDI